jgi:protein arginine N-methyltransferase 7
LEQLGLELLDRSGTESKGLEALVGRVGDDPLVIARLASLLLAMGREEKARELSDHAVGLAPENGEVRAIAASIATNNVAGWYFPMVRDHARHAAIEAAMKRVIKPGARVLEIGTGTGLFAMMAARAGAAEVVTCDSNPVVAAAASEIISRNGYSDRVRVIAKSSADLQVGVDLAEPADVLIWDTLGSSMIGAGALPLLETAYRRLLRPGAPAIPARGSIVVALAEYERAARWRMETVEGFDLSPFNRLAATSHVLNVDDERLALRSEPAELFSFDFQSGGPFPEGRASVELSSTGGSVNGIAQWLRFELDGEGTYENYPGRLATSVFNVVFYPRKDKVNMAPGAVMKVSGSHDRLWLRIWAD